MNKPSRLLLGAMTLVILVPQVTFAAWWKPSTWKVFTRTSAPAVQVIPQQSAPTLPVKEATSTTQKPQPKKATPKPVNVTQPTNAPVVVENNQVSSEIRNYRTQLSDAYQKEISTLDQDVRVRGVLVTSTQLKIEDIKDTINETKGFQIGNPDSAQYVQPFLQIYQAQEKYEEQSLAAQKSFIAWIEETKGALIKNLPVVLSVQSKDQYDLRSAELQFVKDAFKKGSDNIESWFEKSRGYQAQIDGIIAGAKSRSSTTQTPVVQVSYPPVYTPPSIRNCISKVNFLNELETMCY